MNFFSDNNISFMYHCLSTLPLCAVTGACQSSLRCNNYCCDDGWCNQASDGCSMCIDNACQPIPPQQLPYEENLQLASPPELPTHWSSNNMKGDRSVIWTVAVDGTDHSFKTLPQKQILLLYHPKLLLLLLIPLQHFSIHFNLM
jgi:hypothetical protein